MAQTMGNDATTAMECIEAEMSYLDLATTTSVEESEAGIVQSYLGCMSYWKKLPNCRLGSQQYTKAMIEHVGAVKWRFRMQENFYFAMVSLANKNLLRLNTLRSPLCWSVLSEDIDPIWDMLLCFERVEQCQAVNAQGLDGSFTAPERWLAMLILRTCTDVTTLFEVLVTTKLLGEFNFEEFDQCIMAPIPIEEHRPEILPEHYRVKPNYCFWLPTAFGGANDRNWAQQWRQRYYRARNMYETYFGTGSWGDASMMEDSVRDILGY